MPKVSGGPLGEHIKKLANIDLLIDGVNAKLKALKKKRTKVESKLLKKFNKSSIEGASGPWGKAFISEQRFPSIKDRAKFQKYVLKKKAFDLYQNRISSKAYFDRLEEGESVPGISIFNKIGVKIRKARG